MTVEGSFSGPIDENARRRFEAAWNAGTPQPIECFLPPAEDARYLATLCELVCIELEFQWEAWNQRGLGPRAARPPLVEAYLARFPPLRQTEYLLALVRQEFRVRQQAGDGTSPREYRERFPEIDATALDLRTVHPVGVAGPPDLASGVPGYEVLETIGRGGMGIIFKARQLGLKRIVALKRILAGVHASAEELERFRQEAEAVAQLRHPHIVQIYDIGEQDGQPFFSLEYVEGGTLAEYIAGTPQPARPAAQLLGALARAVEHAHQHGILHRDLKPANVLLQAPHGSLKIEGQSNSPDGKSGIADLQAVIPKITDFGLAKQVGSGAGRTATGEVLGTPSYMAPEQALGQPRAIGPATDVYALGAILYELLTGRPPYRGESPMDTLDQVCRGELVPPRRLLPKIPPDLETICLKCLARFPGRRYPRAGDLADDLQRFLDGRPILARRAGPWERGVMWVKRRPALAAFLGSSAAGLLALVVLGVLWYGARLQGALDRERLYNAEATFQAEQARQARAQQLFAQGQERKVRGSLYTAHMLLAHQAWQNENVERVLELLETHRPGPGHDDLRGFEWYRLWRLCHSERRTLRGHTGNVEEVAFSPDGQLIATASGDRTVKLWDAATGAERATLRGHQNAVLTLAFAPDGKTLATGSWDRTIRLWDVATTTELAVLEGHTREVWAVAFSPDGKKLASGAGEFKIDAKYGELKLWDTTHLRETAALSGHQGAVAAVAFVGDGSTLASGSWDGSVRLWDALGGKEIATFGKSFGQIYTVAVSPNGQSLAAGDNRGWVHMWDVSSRKVRHTFSAHAGRVSQLAFSPDGATLVTASRDRAVKLWNVESGKPAGTILGHRAQLQTMALAPDGRSLATGGYDQIVKIWDLPPLEERDNLRGHVGAVATIGYSPDGKLLASAGSDRRVRIWNVASGHLEATIPADEQRLAADGHTALILRVAFAPEGETLATAGMDGFVKLWQVRSGNLLATWKVSEVLVFGLAYHPDGKTLVTGDYKGVLTFWDLEKGQARARIQAHPDYVMSLDCAPTGELLASAGSLPYSLKLWDAVTGQERGTISKNVADSGCVAFHPSGKLLVSGTGEGTVLFFDLPTQELRQTLKGHTGGVFCLAVTTDGKRLAVGSGDGTVKIWDLTAWQEVATLPAHRLRVSAIAFSPDGKTLATSSVDGTVRLWRAAPDDAGGEKR